MVALMAVVAVLLVLSQPRDMQVPPMDPPLAASSGGAPSPSAEAVLLELADPVDRGNVVELSWTSSADLQFGVTIEPEGKDSYTVFVHGATSYRVEVDPGRRYCFEIRGTNGQSLYLSQPKPIRGATCRR
jgi:hypothetical protein